MAKKIEIDISQLRCDLGITCDIKTKKTTSKRGRKEKEVDLNKLRDKALKKKR